MNKTGSVLGAVLLGVLALLPAAPAAAEDFPTRPVRILVGYAAGGTTDIVARLVGAHMAETLRQPVVVENRPGAATNVAAQAVRNAPADGYTLFMGTTVMVTNVVTPRRTPYRMEDFQPVSLVIQTPFAFTAHPSAGETLEQYLANARANPGRYFYATLGTGGTPHLLAERLRQLTGIQITDVAYAGAAPALLAITRGDVQTYFDSIPSSLGQLRAGRVRILAVTSAERLSIAPDLPTFRELGYPGMTIQSWFGLFAPAGTPRAVVDRLNAAVGEALENAEVRQRLLSLASLPSHTSPEGFSQYLEEDERLWRGILGPLNLQLD